MTNMVEGNITNQYPLTKIRNYYRMGDGILDGFPIIQDQTSPNLAHIPTTNLLTYSEYFSQWTPSNVTLTSGQTSPDNNTNAYKIIPTSVNSPHSVNNVSSTGQTLSVTAKKGEYKNLLLWINSSSKGLGVNLDDNSIFRNVGVLHYNITELTDGWKRIDVTLDASYTGAPAFYVYDNSGTPAITFAGNGSDGLFIYAAQFEAQSQATAYLKSDGIAAVRKATTTNLIPYSEDTSQSSWTDNHITWSHNLYPSPIGTNNATKITSTNNGAKVVVSLNLENSKAYTVSMYIKNISTTSVKMLVYQNNDDAIPLNSNYQDELSTTEWVRVEKTFTTTSTATGGTVQIQPARDIPNNEKMYIWGLQVEEQTQAETYAKTTGLPVTIDLFTENNYGTMTNMSSSDIIEDTPNN